MVTKEKERPLFLDVIRNQLFFSGHLPKDPVDAFNPEPTLASPQPFFSCEKTFKV